jgi:uncharacterized RDD family membrane protein YckC
MKYFVMTNERREGPFTEGQLRERIQAGEVHAQTPVWHKGLEKWKPCGNLFGDMPELDSWYAMVDGRHEGPMTPRVFQNEVRAGRVTAATVVWRTGMPRWRRLGKVAFDQGVVLPDAETPLATAPATGIPTPHPGFLGASASAPSISQFSAPTPPPMMGADTPHPGPLHAVPTPQAHRSTRQQPPAPPPIPPAGGGSGVNTGMNPLFDMDFDLPPPSAKPAKKPARGAALARFDGVLPPFDYGGFWIRFLAIFIDSVLVGMVVAVAMTVLGLSMMVVPPEFGSAPPEVQTAAALSGLVRRVLFLQLLICLYPVLTTWWLGGTFGKLVCGLRVVRSDGEALSIMRCAARESCRLFISGQIFCIGFLLAAFTDEKKTLHDMICDTRVVKNG